MGHIEVRASREDGVLRMQVRDDGPELPKGRPFEEGVGLGSTHARLRQLYGSDQRLELRQASGGGLEAEIVIPFNAEPEADGAAYLAAAEAKPRAFSDARPPGFTSRAPSRPVHVTSAGVPPEAPWP